MSAPVREEEPPQEKPHTEVARELQSRLRANWHS
jgi:hypothetical protein